MSTNCGETMSTSNGDYYMSRPWLYIMVWVLFLHSCDDQSNYETLNTKMDNITTQIEKLTPAPIKPEPKIITNENHIPGR